MKKQIYLAVALCALISSCAKDTEIYQDSDFAQKIKIENRKKLAKEGLYYQKSSYAYPLATDKIWERFTTDKYKFTSVDEARMFFCKIFEEYMQSFDINQNDPAFSPDFHPTERNVELIIKFVNEDGHLRQTPYISKVQNEYGYLVYTSFNVPKKKMEVIYKEPFETGYNIYLQTKNNSGSPTVK